MTRGLWLIALATLLAGADCARNTVSCPEGTAIVDFENGGRECVPVGPDGGLGGTGGMGKPECEDDLDCAFEEASRCDQDSGMCEPCLEDVDCAGIDGLPRCDAEEGLCVQCAPATEAMDCGERSCDPATQECSDIVRGIARRVRGLRVGQRLHGRRSRACRCSLETCRFAGASVSGGPGPTNVRSRSRFRCQTHARACRARRPPSTAA